MRFAFELPELDFKKTARDDYRDVLGPGKYEDPGDDLAEDDEPFGEEQPIVDDYERRYDDYYDEPDDDDYGRAASKKAVTYDRDDELAELAAHMENVHDLNLLDEYTRDPSMTDPAIHKDLEEWHEREHAEAQHGPAHNLFDLSPTTEGLDTTGTKKTAAECNCPDEYAHRHLADSEMAGTCPVHGKTCSYCGKDHEAEAEKTENESMREGMKALMASKTADADDSSGGEATPDADNDFDHDAQPDNDEDEARCRTCGSPIWYYGRPSGGHWVHYPKKKKHDKESAMNKEAAILEAMAKAGTLQEQQALAEELEEVRAQKRLAIQDERDVDLADSVIKDHLTPVMTHSMHTQATDWVGEEEVEVPGDFTHAMRTEATVWFQKTSAEVKADRGEFAEQAQGVARLLAGQYGSRAPEAARAFLDHVAHLYRVSVDEPGQVDEKQSGNAESGITNYETTGTNPETFDEDFWDESENTGPSEVPSTRADNVKASRRPFVAASSAEALSMARHLRKEHGWSGKTTTDMLRSHSGDLDFMHTHEHNEAKRSRTSLGHTHGSRKTAVSDQEVEQLAEKASDAFWEVVANHFPEVTTGDFPPDATFPWMEACENAIKNWLLYNHPEHNQFRGSRKQATVKWYAVWTWFGGGAPADWAQYEHPRMPSTYLRSFDTEDEAWAFADKVQRKGGTVSVTSEDDAADPSYLASKTASDAEDKAWKDAYMISWIGASNPRGVQHTIEEHTKSLGADHQAVRAMQGHLDFLNGKSLGPSDEDLKAVKSNAARLGIADESGKYISEHDR